MDDQDPTPEDEEEVPICPSCLAVQGEDQLLCHSCGCPQDALSGTVPLVRILAEGYILRQAIGRPQRLITVMGVWLIMGNLILGGVIGFQVLRAEWYWMTLLERLEQGVLAGACVVVGILGILQSSWNYQRSR